MIIYTDAVGQSVNAAEFAPLQPEANMTSHTAFMQSNLHKCNEIDPPTRGKVRDIYNLGQWLLMVTTDRISAFDHILPTGIPDRGRILNGMTLFWRQHLKLDYAFTASEISTIKARFDLNFGDQPDDYAGRTMLVPKAIPALVECVVRGYVAGSGWKDYQNTGEICGIQLPAGLQQAQKLAAPIFTPATKAKDGHDENISFDQMCEILGDRELANDLRNRSITLYQQGAEHAATYGIEIADTKFEWGDFDGRHRLIDEVLTPDSSRFWPTSDYRVGTNPPSYDKQFVRDWLEAADWDKNSEPPALPQDIVDKTRDKYVAAYETITGNEFEWK